MTTATLNAAAPAEQAIEAEQVTMYFVGGMGNVIKMECRRVKIEVGKYAQHSAALHVRWIKKGCRSWRGVVQTFEPSTLVLAGWGHPEPDSMFGSPSAGLDGETTFSRSRYMSFDDGWRRDFDAMIGAYLDANPDVKIVADYREHNTH